MNLIDEIKEIVDSMTNNATDRRIDNRYVEAVLLDVYSSRLKTVLVKYMPEDEDNGGDNGGTNQT
jgi:hypothetical protein